MRSFQVISGENALAQQFINLRHDAGGAGNLLVHQQFGAIALPTNPTSTQTLTLTINGTAVVITFVSVIGATAGNVLIGASAAATLTNLLALLNQPQTTTATGLALSTANQQLVSYLSWPLSGTTITPSSNNTALYAPLTSFSAATTATGGSYTAQTMQLYIEPGVVYVGGTRVIYSGGSTPTVTAPVSHPRIDVLAMDNTGTLSWTTGTENTSPVAPTYPANKVALCEVTNVVAETALYDNENQQSGQGYISTDVRPLLGTAVNLAAVTSDVLPDSDGTRNLGGASFEWNNVYAKFLNGDGTGITNLNVPKLLASLTAGDTFTAGDAAYVGPFQSDGGILLDTNDVNNGASNSQSITVGSNANRMLVVFGFTTASSQSLGSPTFNGVAMTQIGSGQSAGGGHEVWVWILPAPATGANTLTFGSYSSGNKPGYTWYSLYNVNQSTTPDASGGNSGTTGTTTQAISLTAVAAGAVALIGYCSSVNPNSDNGDLGNDPQSFNNSYSGISNSLYPAGKTVTQNFLYTGTGNGYGYNILSLAPATAPVTRALKASSGATLRFGLNTYTSFLGFADAAITAGNAGNFALAGPANNGLSSLIAGLPYYLNDTAGTIGTSPGTNTRKVGIALDMTHLLVTNIW